MSSDNNGVMDREHATSEVGPVILYATFTASQGNAEAIGVLLGEYAKKVRSEAGNVMFEVSCRVDQPESFFVYEVFVDQAAFQHHLDAPYGPPFNAAIAPMILEPQSVLTSLKRF